VNLGSAARKHGADKTDTTRVCSGLAEPYPSRARRAPLGNDNGCNFKQKHPK
jgi:hypothetical protein